MELLPVQPGYHWDTTQPLSMSPQVDKLFTALHKAIPAIPGIIKNRKGHFTYADLDEVLSKVIPALENHNLFVTQYPVHDHWLVTIIGHVSGQYIVAGYQLPKEIKRGVTECQSRGGDVTYFKRIAICAALGIAAEDDNDGGTQQEQNQQPKRDFTPNPNKAISEKQIGFIRKLASQKQGAQEVYAQWGIDSAEVFATLSSADASALIEQLSVLPDKGK